MGTRKRVTYSGLKFADPPPRTPFPAPWKPLAINPSLPKAIVEERFSYQDDEPESSDSGQSL